MNLPRLDRLKPWQLDAAAVTVMLVIALVAYFFEVHPSLARHSAGIATQSSLQDSRTRLPDLQASLQRMKQRKEASENFIREAGVSLEPQSRVNARIAFLEKIASGAGLEVEGFEPGSESPSGRLVAINIRLSAKASYLDVERFLALLHEKSSDCVVVSLELNDIPASPESVAGVIVQLLWHATPEKQMAQN